MKEQTRLPEASELKPKAWPKVAISVLNWNGWRDTIECLGSIRELTYPNYLTIVVDNGSWDDSVEKIKAWARENLGQHYVLVDYSRQTALQGGEEDQEEALEQMPSANRLVLVRNEQNLGFTEGNNVAIHYALWRKCPAGYIFLLNNDTKVEQDCLTQLVNVSHEADAGIVGAVMTEERGKAPIYTVKAGLIRQFFSPIVRADLPPTFPNHTFWRSLWVGGGAMLIRRDVLSAVYSSVGRYLNSGLFMYLDELDFCTLASKSGYSTVFAKRAIVYHKPAQSTGGHHNPIAYYYVERNRVLLANELLPLRWRVLFQPVNVLLCLARVLKNVAQRRLNSSRAILCGLVDGYRGVTGKWKHHDQEAAKAHQQSN